MAVKRVPSQPQGCLSLGNILLHSPNLIDFSSHHTDGQGFISRFEYLYRCGHYATACC